MNYTKDNKNFLNRSNETNIIAYKIQNSDDVILDRFDNGNFIVQTTSGLKIYSTEEMEEVYILNINSCDFERLGWPA